MSGEKAQTGFTNRRYIHAAQTPLIIIIMAKVIYQSPIAYVQGKIGKKSNVVYKHNSIANKEGEQTNFTQLYNAPANYTLTEEAQAARNNFKAVAARVRTAYATEATLNSYKAQFRAQSKVKSLRKFIWDAEAELLAGE